MIRFGGMPLDPEEARVFIMLGKDRLNFRDAADRLFPGHVLRQFRIEIDSSAGMTCFERTGSGDIYDLDIVGLTLDETPDGGVSVMAISAAANNS